jgi:hypothetical protein
MKKTLVALAVLAASGASFAQVTLSGEFAYGYSSKTNGAGANTSGPGIDTGLLVFGAGEDLGGGTRVDIKMSTDSSSGRTGTIGNDDQTIAVTTSFAKFTAGSVQPGDWLIGASGGATWYGLDGKVMSSKDKLESIGVSIPFGAVSLGMTVYGPNGITSEGTGNAGTITPQASTSYSLGYNAGGLDLRANYKSYRNVDGTDATTRNIARVGGNFDFGAAKVGAGYASYSTDGGGTTTKGIVSFTVPVGSTFAVHGEWGSVKVDTNVAAASGTRSGYELDGTYNLSKRTYAILGYGNWQAALADSQNTNQTHLTLVHDF